MPVVAFCPCAPVLVPEVSQGAAADTAQVLAACDAAVRALAGTRGRLVVVGTGPQDAVHPGSASGTLAGFGVPLSCGGTDAPELPLALTVGAWLLDRAHVDPALRRYVQVGPAGHGPDGEDWAAEADALLVMGDGTARLGERAPGGLDRGAASYDDAVVAAIVGGLPDALAALDLEQATRMMAAGAPAWRAVGRALGRRAGRGAAWTAQLLERAEPFGVSYVVALWQPVEDAGT